MSEWRGPNIEDGAVISSNGSAPSSLLDLLIFSFINPILHMGGGHIVPNTFIEGNFVYIHAYHGLISLDFS